MPGRGRNMVRRKKCNIFFLALIFGFWPESPFFAIGPRILSIGPFVALGDSFDLAPADPFLNFSFPSYDRFREGDPPTQQKVLPHLTVRALTDSNSPSARSALALRARALRARAG